MWEETKQSKTHLSQAGDAAGKQGKGRWRSRSSSSRRQKLKDIDAAITKLEASQCGQQDRREGEAGGAHK